MITWEELEHQCQTCARCKLHETRNKVVFGIGPKKARILFVGEGPGQQEDLQGEPFVGAAGQFLDEMLSIIGLDRNNSYITNTVKCRPPQNRDPEATEQDACAQWLEAQIALMRPKLIVCLGRIAAMRLIRPDYKISREHGQWVEKDGVWYTAIYHPSALLRSPDKRPETFKDLKSIQKKLRELFGEDPRYQFND